MILLLQRSFIEACIGQAKEAAKEAGVALPEHAHWTRSKWETPEDPEKLRNMLKTGVGWDCTSFGDEDIPPDQRVDRRERLLTLYTIQNGGTAGQYPDPYGEKLLFALRDKETPFHIHVGDRNQQIRGKVETICAVSGELCLSLYGVIPTPPTDDVSEWQYELDEKHPFEVDFNGCSRVVQPGETLVMKPGDRITLTPSTAHSFWGGDCDICIAREIATLNDDVAGNYFFPALERFTSGVEEDVPAEHILVNEYETLMAEKM